MVPFQDLRSALGGTFLVFLSCPQGVYEGLGFQDLFASCTAGQLDIGSSLADSQFQYFRFSRNLYCVFIRLVHLEGFGFLVHSWCVSGSRACVHTLTNPNERPML